RTWCTSTQAFAPPTPQMMAEAEQAANPPHSINARRRANASTDGPEPINFKNPPYYPIPQAVGNKYPKCVGAPDPQTGEQQLIDGQTFQNNGDVMVAGVTYNDAAYNWIRDKNLYRATTLDGEVPSGKGHAAMPEMPPGSIVLKPMLWPVQAEGYTALPLWDNPPSGDGGKYAGFEVQGKWPRAVAVTPKPQRGVRRKTVKYLYGVYVDDTKPLRLMGPRTYLLAEVVPVDQFYSIKPDLSGLGDCDKAILDASAYWAYKREFRQGDHLIVIAMHVMTKEQPDWTFQSVWWHDKPNFGPYAKDRPNIPAGKAPGPWRHYLMTSTYGNTTAPGGRKLPVAYNPYIELAADHPVKTNCMNCHHRAAWPHKLSSYLATGPNAPDALDKFKMDNRIFDGLLTLDSMWAISDRAR
ncbi:MAG: hypothetical protein LC800_08095, partial [Acidobacteria bacterium]|nr:hypothetical protein [Acidobacteriota bacterium]